MKHYYLLACIAGVLIGAGVMWLYRMPEEHNINIKVNGVPMDLTNKSKPTGLPFDAKKYEEDKKKLREYGITITGKETEEELEAIQKQLDKRLKEAEKE
jgi:hypothetical protein